MKIIIKSFPFWIGVFAGIALSLVIIFVDYSMKFDGLCMDCDNDFGFPLKIYQSGNYIQATKILWAGIFGNTLIFGLFSVCLGVIAYSLLNKKGLK